MSRQATQLGWIHLYNNSVLIMCLSLGAYGCYQASNPPAAAAQSHQWNRQNIPQSTPSQPYSAKPAPGPTHTMRNYAPMPHPYKAPGARYCMFQGLSDTCLTYLPKLSLSFKVYTSVNDPDCLILDPNVITKWLIFSSKVGQPSTPVRQQPQSSPSVNSRQSEYRVSCFSESPQSKPAPHAGFSQKTPPSFSRSQNPTHQYSQQSRPAPVPSPSRPAAAAAAAKQPNNTWNFQNSFGSPKTPLSGNRSTSQSPTMRTPTRTQV